jgi:UDP-N-acetyl-D-glucosamine dehydrogenase
VRAIDPHVVDAHIPAGVQRVDFDPAELARASAVLMLVDHDEFDPQVVASSASYIIDTRHVLPAGDNVELL